MPDKGKAGPKTRKPRAFIELAHRIVATVREPLIVLDGDLRIISVNDSFYRTFNVIPSDTEGRLIFEVGNRQWDIPSLRILLETILPANQHFEDFEVEHDFPEIGRRKMLLNARRLTGEEGTQGLILLAIEDVTERKRVQETLWRLNEELEQQVKACTEELTKTVAHLAGEECDRQLSDQALVKLNEELEQRVKERTAELEFAKGEMESFSYSVSHDLKAPVRTIEGFSRMLMAEHADKLDAEVLQILQVITTNTDRMRHLIDDLLALSRLGRQTIKKSDVNLGNVTGQVFERLKSQEPGRNLQLMVNDLPTAYADYSLLYQVMMNLLGNAIKYTRDRGTALIEVGGRIEGNEKIFYVKDNGAGFDERFADKLFGPFQRLHLCAEYEGTGVGLAIVKRIIQRHGGRVWGEGKVNEGATFYFTLPIE